jgi:hypothetical protein
MLSIRVGFCLGSGNIIPGPDPTSPDPDSQLYVACYRIAQLCRGFVLENFSQQETLNKLTVS